MPPLLFSPLLPHSPLFALVFQNRNEVELQDYVDSNVPRHQGAEQQAGGKRLASVSWGTC